MTVTRGPIDRHPIGLKICAGFVNVIHTKSQMTKVATVVGQAIIAVPIVGQFNWAILLAFWRYKDQSEAPVFTFFATGLF
jgi:hypothetical protein